MWISSTVYVVNHLTGHRVAKKSNKRVAFARWARGEGLQELAAGMCDGDEQKIELLSDYFHLLRKFDEDAWDKLMLNKG